MKKRVKERLCLCEILREMLIKNFAKKEEDITSHMNSSYLKKD